MLILPSNTLPFIWDFQSTQHWAFVLLMFRGPKRMEGLTVLGNWYSQNSIILMLKAMVWPYWTDQVHQRKPRQRNLHIITPRWLWRQFCFPVSQSYSLDQTVNIAATLPAPEAQHPCATDRRGRGNFDLQESGEVKEQRLNSLAPKKHSQILPW